MYRHSVPVETGPWYRVDSASGSNSAVTVFQNDGVTAIRNAFAGAGSTVQVNTRRGNAEFLSSSQTLYLKRLTYKGAVAGDTPITSTGADLTLPAEPASPSDVAKTLAGLPTTYARTLGSYPMPVARKQVVPRRWVKSYKPASLTTTAVPFDGSSADLDATNLAVTFVAPESGMVRYRLTANGSASGGTALQWSLGIGGTRIGQCDVVVVTGPATGDAPYNSYSVTGVLSTYDNTNTLVPGNTYTVTWRHRATASSQYAYTRYGGSAGHATLEIEEVIATPLTVPYTASLTATGYIPEWLCNDRQTLLGTVTGPQAKYVCWSTNDGGSWTQHSSQFPATTSHMRELDNGEIMVSVEAPLSGGQASIWVSSGFAANKATATFTQKVTATPVSTATWHTWSLDTYGPICLASEYGPKNGPGDMASKVYISEDYGVTWRVAFDLTAYVPSAGAHTHGVCYDPWWDAIWVTTGDGPSLCSTWLSLDRGATWRQFTNTATVQQFTSVIALPECILFVTDQGNPGNGIYRVPRVHPRNPRWELAYSLDASNLLVLYGDGTYRSRSLPTAPALFSIQAGSAAGYGGRLIATHDGYTFKEVWRDSSTYLEAGLRECFGPTLTGKYHGRVDQAATSYAADALQLVLTPNP